MEKTIEGKKYGFDEEGHRLFGFVSSMDGFDMVESGTPNAFMYGDYYYGSIQDACKTPEANARQTGWLEYVLAEDYKEYKAGDAVWLYFNSNGIKITDRTYVIDGSSYNFDENGVLDRYVVYRVDDIASAVYTGHALKPEVTVRQNDGTAIDASKYKVSYTDNIEVGRATATVELISTGEKISKGFDINLASPVIEAADVNATYDGTAHAAEGKARIPNGIELDKDKLKIKYYTDAESTAASVPDKGIAGTWNKDSNGKWAFTASNDKRKYSNEWAYVANPNADTSKGQEASSWFRFGTNGTMLTGWYKNVYGDWYYLNPVSDNALGRMLKGWQYINGYWYYLEEKDAASLGRLYVSKQTSDGKTVDAYGRWVRNGIAVTDANTKPAA